MANDENLVPLTTKKAREIGRKGGLASVKARRAKKERGEVLEQLLDMTVNNPAMANNLAKIGVKKSDRNWRYAIDAAQVIKAAQGDPRAYKNIMDAIYGLQTQHSDITSGGDKLEPPVALVEFVNKK